MPDACEVVFILGVLSVDSVPFEYLAVSVCVCGCVCGLVCLFVGVIMGRLVLLAHCHVGESL